ncbi:MAG: hypothetical protein MUO50_00060, partial [Longimicrobiales bacterium]|nr:hypothetical protein [Longimicrobiales bacterium]
MDIRIQTMGRFAVWLNDRELTQILEQPIRAALLVYLAVERDVTRDAAESVIWGDLPPGKARHALNQTLYRLRKDLGEDWLLAQGDLLTVTGGVRVDAREFETAVKAGAWEEGLEFYRGTFLDGWHLLGTSPFEHWTDRHRLRLSRLHREACRVGLSELKAAGRYSDGLKLARAWVQRDSMEDEAQHNLIELLARTGQRGEALEQYEMYANLLAEDELVPLDETRELVEGIRNGSALAGSPEAPSHPVASSHLESPAGSGSWKPRRLRRTLFLASTLGLLTLSALLFVLSRRSAPELGLVANRVLVVP